MQPLTFHDRHVVADNADYYCVLDELRSEHVDGFDQLLIAHLDFKQFSKEALTRLLREWAVFRSIVEAPLFAYCADGEQQPDKWARFVRLLGFEEVPDAFLPASDGSSRRIFVSHKVSNASVSDQKHFQHHNAVGCTVPLPTAGVPECSRHL